MCEGDNIFFSCSSYLIILLKGLIELLINTNDKFMLCQLQTIGFLKLTFQPLHCFGTNTAYK